MPKITEMEERLKLLESSTVQITQAMKEIALLQNEQAKLVLKHFSLHDQCPDCKRKDVAMKEAHELLLTLVRKTTTYTEAYAAIQKLVEGMQQ